MAKGLRRLNRKLLNFLRAVSKNDYDDIINIAKEFYHFSEERKLRHHISKVIKENSDLIKFDGKQYNLTEEGRELAYKDQFYNDKAEFLLYNIHFRQYEIYNYSGNDFDTLKFIATANKCGFETSGGNESIIDIHDDSLKSTIRVTKQNRVFITLIEPLHGKDMIKLLRDSEKELLHKSPIIEKKYGLKFGKSILGLQFKASNRHIATVNSLLGKFAKEKRLKIEILNIKNGKMIYHNDESYGIHDEAEDETTNVQVQTNMTQGITDWAIKGLTPSKMQFQIETAQESARLTKERVDKVESGLSLQIQSHENTISEFKKFSQTITDRLEDVAKRFEELTRFDRLKLTVKTRKDYEQHASEIRLLADHEQEEIRKNLHF